ncbi:MAG TPA: CHASE3 domain-containing protein [Myxococcaceae bacterium]
MRFRAWHASVVGFAVACAVIAGLAWLSLDRISRLQEETARARHSLAVREKIEDVLSLMKDAETGQRGYIITGDPGYLAPFGQATVDLPAQLAALRQLTQNDPAQLTRFQNLENAITQKLAELDATVRARTDLGFDVAARIIATDRGKRLMDDIRQLAREMVLEEDRLYAARTAREKGETRAVLRANVGGFGVALLIVGIAMALLHWTTRAREREQAARATADAVAAVTASSEAWFRTTLVSIGDAVIATDETGRIRTMNPVAESLTGWTEAEARNRPLDAVFRIVNETTQLPVENPVTRVLRDGRVVGLANHTVLLARDGRAVPIDDSAAPIRPREGSMTGAVLVFRDITARRQTEREQARSLEREQAARRELEIASRSKDEFVTTLSHELRTPLNAILGWVQLLRAGTLDETARVHALEVIERNTRTQTRMVEDLLDISRIMTGQFRIDPRPVDLATVVTAAVDAVRPAIDAKALHLATHLDPDAGPVAGDPDRLQQVVWNLLTNAVKFTPRGGRIDVTLERRGSQVEVRVTDTGRGIAADFLPHVFERFSQAEASTSRSQPGLGIGLALVRHLVELHGGVVDVESEGEGRGATFTVRLPVPVTLLGLHADGDGAGMAGPGPDPFRPLTGMTILAVDDDADARELLRTAFQQAGAQVILADSARAALAALEASAPDVLVSDIGMPDGSGYELLEGVRAVEHGSRLPAVALTAYARPEDRDRAIRAGFQLHVSKPIDPAALVRAVALVCGRVTRI